MCITELKFLSQINFKHYLILPSSIFQLVLFKVK
ncbi:hypothetical protein Smp_186260 [Schistosoma mansoni]|nr:hypothetical protein Smp_186260 [Schistosoma mansoni]|eukprot:XP_018644561.1 hypothetical protein Smp_186260 [Schistosoma mansoni]